jgi:hypothetical protein
LSTGAPAKSKKPYVSPETEAYAVMQFKGNHSRWQKQFQVAKDNRYCGKIQRILGKKKPGEVDGPILEHWIMDQPPPIQAQESTNPAENGEEEEETAPPKRPSRRAKKKGQEDMDNAEEEKKDGDEEEKQAEEEAKEAEEEEKEAEEEEKEAEDSGDEEDKVDVVTVPDGEFDEVSAHCFMSHWGWYFAVLGPIDCPIGHDGLPNWP